MNERTLELALQAGLKKPHASDREYIGDFDWRKFADLIVKECADIVIMSSDRHRKEYFANLIKEHFGVEE